jgi:hypothetical protein
MGGMLQGGKIFLGMEDLGNGKIQMKVEDLKGF